MIEGCMAQCRATDVGPGL